MGNISVLSVDKENKSVELLVRSLTLTFRHDEKGRLFFNTRSESSSCDPRDMQLPNKILAAAYKAAAEELKNAH